ncbi:MULTISPECIES: hypothetical protein [unclassified Bacillus (in: firmicutes)]|uniref:hypothetical protein n=1 Tax=unclassified Bacillus (in: firmicutes) TaxID=185979 RepID=UPI0008E058CC|nr:MULTISPECIES: hypothetical protein [unclassified Bacillus (in: firmicutes)]SFI80275.1 hypothetical protein SAMN04488574_104291 [Bacillus sp. 71mf]SFS85451.1 hypothetical protein SAMN04488145_10475 [Bacillus sp. 103mf]
MNHVISKKRWIIWFAITSLIILSNILVYALPIMSPLPSRVALGSLFDFILTIPIVTYILIIRKRYSLKYVFPVILAGYVVARFIIPNPYFESFSFITYIVVAGEIVFLCLELYLFYKIARKLPAIIRSYKKYRLAYSSFSHASEKAVYDSVSENVVANVLLSECKLLYYALFSWRKKVHAGSDMFTYHKKTGSIAFYIMLIHATLIESIGFHYFLHQWNPIVAWVLLILNIYATLFFLAEIQAIRLCPYVVTDKELILQVGLTKQLIVPFYNIESIHHYKGLLPSKMEQKQIFDAAVNEFIKEPAKLEIVLTEPMKATMLYGFQKIVTKVHINVDDERAFYDAIMKKVQERSSHE